jgi:hypothetical protein
MWRGALVFLMLLMPLSAHTAPAVVESAGPSAVGVTIYRSPSRGENPLDKDDLGSFALISETRVVDLPPGIVTIRFEGVAGGIVPQSAILFGSDPRERNRDAALLSQRGLVDAFTGQQVILRRTNPATGAMIEERATIRSAADRLIISTPQGSEAVYCSGLNQTLIYPNAPASLSPKPVLSMTTKDQPGGRATITLAYLAAGFDWDANYVGTLAPDGKSLALFSWLTMASADETSFVDATTSAVAGRLNRSDETIDTAGQEARKTAENLDVRAQCWPQGTTGSPADLPTLSVPAPAPMSFAMYNKGDGEWETVIVTATKRYTADQFAAIAVTAVAENVGDLVLYRIPIPVTVAARSQKQVAFLADRTVEGEVIHRLRLSPYDDYDDSNPIKKLFRFTNTTRNGLGVPLPSGGVVLYQEGAIGRALIGEAKIMNKTVDEEVDIVFGNADSVTIEEDDDYEGDDVAAIVRNASPAPVRFELEFLNDDDARFVRLPRGTVSKPGKKVWSIILPANSERRFRFGVKDIEP